MDSWIVKRIRTTSLRRVVVWSLALVGGVLLATSDHRYIANFLRGPYRLAQADLDSIRDVTQTPRYYARVAGDRVIDTGIRQYTIHTQNGIETSREESGAYNAFAVGNRYLVVRTAGDDSQIADHWVTSIFPRAGGVVAPLAGAVVGRVVVPRLEKSISTNPVKYLQPRPRKS